MPRKKMKKRSIKPSGTNKKLAKVQKMETEWMRVPLRLVAQLDKQINRNKKQENKLNKAIDKINAKLGKAEARVKAASSKMQLKAANKKMDIAAKAQNTLTRQLAAITSMLDDLMGRQSKFNALQKCLNQFNSEWTRSSRKTTAHAKPGRKSKLKSVTQMRDHADEEQRDNATEEITELAS